ncbi:MAG: cell wall-binding repeat-containing protein [Candidatus Limnocylindrales bacterium]
MRPGPVMPIARRRISAALLAFALAVAAAPAAPAAPAAAASLTPIAAEAHELDLLNGQRAAAGLAPVIMDPRVQAIAEARSMDMATLHYFSHTQPDGRTAFSMLNAAAIAWSSAGEIIAWNSGFGDYGSSADEAAAQWHDSAPHYAIITTAAYTAAGVGVAYDSSSGRTYWTAIFIDGPPPPPPPPPPSDPDRVAGADRYATAAATSAAAFAPGVAVAYVATGEAYPDALAGGAAAARDRAPVLLVKDDLVPMSTALELDRLKPGRIVLLGGSGAVDTPVMSLLDGYTGGSVTRLSGSDRYATAAAISRATFGAGVPVVYVATGLNFADALAGSAAAAHVGVPVLLVNLGLPAATATELARLKPGRIVVLGGPGAVPDAVKAKLVPYATSGRVDRVWGSDRYATAVALSRSVYPSAATIYIATGRNFPDALAGAPLGGPLLLVPGVSAPQEVIDEVRRLQPSRVVVLGGSSEVADAVVAELRAAAGH